MGPYSRIQIYSNTLFMDAFSQFIIRPNKEREEVGLKRKNCSHKGNFVLYVSKNMGIKIASYLNIIYFQRRE